MVATPVARSAGADRVREIRERQKRRNVVNILVVGVWIYI